MTDVASHNLTGSRFEDVYLTDARFQRRRPHQGRLAPFDLTGVMICDAALLNVDLSGEDQEPAGQRRGRRATGGGGANPSLS